MRVFDQTKKVELNEFDSEKGRLVPDTRVFTVAATEYVPEVSHYETVKQYENGGKDVVKIIDVEGKAAVPEHDENEDIFIYVPYTDEELAQNETLHKKEKLKRELEKIKEDIEQESFGLVRDDYAEKKLRAAQIVNELRAIEGKPVREIK